MKMGLMVAAFIVVVIWTVWRFLLLRNRKKEKGVVKNG